MALTFALAGNPNSGKTTLFNELTGSTAHVGNWPGVTVDRKEGRYRGSAENITIIDLPGIYSLSPYTQEEVIARNYLIDQTPDLIINIIDATNLERNLYLSTQLMETDTPIVVALNMYDLVNRDGDTIDIAGLEQALGLPVVPISALRATGVKELMERAEQKAREHRAGVSLLTTTVVAPQFTRLFETLKAAGLKQPLFQSAKFLEGDPLPAFESLPVETREAITALRQEAAAANGIEDLEAWVADQRYRYITSHYSTKLTRKVSGLAGGLHRSERVDRLLTHRFAGIPLFLVFMFLVFHLTFGQNLFGIQGVPSPGVWLQGLMEILVGWISGGVSALLTHFGASAWAHGLVVDGIIGGVGSMLSFVPQILLLFLFLTIMEDSGYMARAAFIMDRLLQHFGLSGNSFVPMLMGFGCSVPALMASRTLKSEKDRRLTMMLVPFMSCGAKLPIYAVFGAALFSHNSDIMVFAVYLIGIIMAILSGILLKNTVLRGESSPFIMELPAYHLPRLKNLVLRLWEKLRGFIVRAGTVILGATIVIWLLSNFNYRLQMVEANSVGSMLGMLGTGLHYIFLPLGFASGPDGWKAAVAILTGIIAKEAVVSTMGVLYNPGVAGDALDDSSANSALLGVIATSFSPLAALSFMVFNLLSFPCMAAISALRSEMNNGRWTAFTLAYWFSLAWVVCFLIYNVGTLLGF